MKQIQISFATVFGIGYMGKGAGTIAAAACCIVFFYFSPPDTSMHPVAVLAIILIAGTWSAGAVEKRWGQDNSKIVIDEVAGILVTLLFVPVEGKYIAIGFVLFRFFDIVKPLGIRKTEKLHGGLGIMADDVLAGVYSRLLLQLIVVFKPYFNERFS